MDPDTQSSQQHTSLGLNSNSSLHPGHRLGSYSQISGLSQITPSHGITTGLNTRANSSSLNNGHPTIISSTSCLPSDASNHMVQYVGQSDVVTRVSGSNHLPVSMNNFQTDAAGHAVMPGHSSVTSNAQTDVLGSLLSKNSTPAQHPQASAATRSMVGQPSAVGGPGAVKVAPAPGSSASISNAAGSHNSNGPSSSGTTGVATDPEKRKLIQQQLLLLLHAHRCQRQETENNGASNNCTNPHCRTMRGVLQHMINCSDGKDCRKPHCASSRQIISHWKNCSSKECPVCEPLKQNQHNVRSQMVQQRQQQQNSARPASSSTAVSNLSGGSSLRGPGSSVSSIYPSSGPHDVASTGSCNGVGSRGSQPAGARPPPDPSDWRSSVDNNQRNNLVRRIVNMIFPSPDPAAYNDPRMKNLVDYASNVEREMYNTAKDLEDYFTLLAEKCFKIQKELDEKRKSKQLAAQGAQQQLQHGQQQQQSMNVCQSQCADDEDYKMANCLQNAFDRHRLKTESQSGAMGGDVKPAVKAEPKTEEPMDQSASGLSLAGPMVKIDKSKWKRWTREELLRHFLPLHDEIFNDRNAEFFRAPVDHVALQIPDYPLVIKHPMDLSTIRNNLEDGKYTDPWQVVDHFRLMFNNAWLYNKKSTKVYKMCTKLSELFESQVDQVMRAMGYCCGHEYYYQPQVLTCASVNVCSINRDATYYVYTKRESQTPGLVCDRYHHCEKCFTEAPGDSIMLADEPGQTPVPVPKSLFEQRKNNVKEMEEDVICNDCGRKWHKVCALHMNEIWPTGFLCPWCLRERNLKRKENKFTAKRLPTTRLSTFLEKRVNDFLKKKEVNAGEVTIRVLASSDKTVEVKPLMRARFTETGELSESFPYRLKAIFAFQEIEGQDVCFFGLYVQEYGSDAPQPNRRRVYVAYLDSVFYFRPKQYRTDVYHEILVGYLNYAKGLGYTMAHIWACPPGEGDDYIFHMHPIEQRIPKAKRLQDWYRRMLQKAIIEGIVVDYKNILKDAIEHQLVSPTEIPYFEGDFWPNTLEDILKELAEEEEKRRLAEQHLQLLDDEETDPEEDDLLSGQGGGLHDHALDAGSSANKKAKRKKCSKKSGGSSANKRKKMDTSSDCTTELSRKVYDTMDKLKEIFFVIRLHRGNSPNLPASIMDKDPLINSELMESRDAFLQMARERHLEFSTLRRAKYSTMVILYELHNEGRQNFMYNCNVCQNQIVSGVRWHCNECEEFDLCPRCYKEQTHQHPMVKYGVGLDDGGYEGAQVGERGGSGAAGAAAQGSATTDRYIKSLVHAINCKDANCRMQSCTPMKRLLCHSKVCKRRTSHACMHCKQLLNICYRHARVCTEKTCNIPFCINIRYRLKQQQLQRKWQNNKLLRRRISNMNRGATTATTTTAGPVAPGGSASSAGTPSASGYAPPTSAYQAPHAPNVVVGSSAPASSLQQQQQQQLMRISQQQPGQTSQQAGQPRVVIQQSSGVQLPGAQPQQQPARQWQQQQSASSGSASTSTTNQKAAELASRATPEDIAAVNRVIAQIKQTGASSEEQHRQFIDWIKQHPELHPAFFALHKQNKSNNGMRQQQQQQRSQTQAGGGGEALQQSQAVTSQPAAAMMQAQVTPSSVASGGGGGATAAGKPTVVGYVSNGQQARANQQVSSSGTPVQWVVQPQSQQPGETAQVTMVQQPQATAYPTGQGQVTALRYRAQQPGPPQQPQQYYAKQQPYATQQRIIATPHHGGKPATIISGPGAQRLPSSNGAVGPGYVQIHQARPVSSQAQPHAHYAPSQSIISTSGPVQQQQQPQSIVLTKGMRPNMVAVMPSSQSQPQAPSQQAQGPAVDKHP